MLLLRMFRSIVILMFQKQNPLVFSFTVYCLSSFTEKPILLGFFLFNLVSNVLHVLEMPGFLGVLISCKNMLKQAF